MNDISVLVGGKAGDGIKRLANLVARLFNRSGYFVFVHEDYPSLIKGGHNFAIIRASDKPIYAINENFDIMIALNQETIDKHKVNLKTDGVIIFDSDCSTAEGIEISLTKITNENSFPSIMRNIVSFGVLAKLLNQKFDIIEDCIKGYGTGWPDSWNHRYAVYNKFSNTAINPPGGGFSDNYCFFLSNNENATGVVESDELEFDEWPEYCFLRAGFFIKQDVASGASASRVTLYLSDGLSLMTKYYAVSSDVTDWEEITATGVPFITSPNLANYINGTLNRSLKGAYRIDVSSSSRHNVFLDDVYVEHIRDISPHAETSDRVVPAGSNTFFPLVPQGTG